MIFLTGDTHRRFSRIWQFADRMRLTAQDTLIILGDAGINFNLDWTDDSLMKAIADAIPCTLLCLHGNHEERPYLIPGYEEVPWRGGTVYRKAQYPSILFAKDGSIYDLDGRSAVAIGGAYSVDKPYRLARGAGWFPSEQPSPEIRREVEAALDRVNWKVDLVLSHTCPYKFIPREMFLSSIDQSTVDNSTEYWLDTIEERLDYGHWYFGHYHCNKRAGKYTILFEDYEALPEAPPA